VSNNSQIVEAEHEIAKLIELLVNTNVDRLPTETELVHRLSYGRYTIRKAVEHFVSEGTLEKVQGRGTFIVEKKTRVTFSGWIGTEPPGDLAIRDLMTAFHLRQPGIRIDYRPFPYYQTIDRNISLSLHGTAPDVMQLTPPILTALNDLNLLLPLDEVVNHSHLKRRYSVDVDSGRIGRKLFAVTWGLSPLILYYNKNVFRKAGLDPNQPPRTLEELKEMSVRITQSSKGENWGISLPLTANDPNFLWLYPYFLSFGGGFADLRSGNLIVDSEQNQTALRWLADLHLRGGVPGAKDITEGRMLFAADRLGFWLDGPWLRGLFRQLSGIEKEFDSHYGIATFPIGPSGRSESILWNHSLAISAQCRNVRNAYNWIEYLTTEEECAKRHFDILGMLPPLRDVLNTPYFHDDAFARVCVDQMETVSVFPIDHPLFAKSVPFASQVISDVIAQGLNPVERLGFLNEILQMINQNRFLSIFSH